MKIIVLAAGYATRLYPLTLTRPKPLLTVADKPMIENVLDHLSAIPGIDSVHVVVNDKFFPQFEAWAEGYRRSDRPDLKLLNDQSADESSKLGAVGDLQLVLEQHGIDDDLIVVAGDNLFSKPLKGFGDFCRGRDSVVLGVYDIGTLEQAKKYGVVSMDGGARITEFVEKPDHPRSTLIGIGLYYFPRNSLGWIREYISAGNNLEHPGRLIQWLYPRLPVCAWEVPGLWYDIGSKETLEEANRIFSK